MKFMEGMVIQHKKGNTPYKIIRINTKYKRDTKTMYRLEPLFDGARFSVNQRTIKKNYIIAKTWTVLHGTT